MHGEPEDEEGYLYVAHYGAGVIAVVDPSGRVTQNLPAGGKNPTNCCFGGPNFSTLFITETETNTLRRIEMNRRGQKLFLP